MALLNRNWEKDVVYLIQLPRAGCIPSISPFALKLETWLRIAAINYQNVSNCFTRCSENGQIPFVELNGEQMSDSNSAVAVLSQKFNVDMDSRLDVMEAAHARAYHALIEDSIRWQMIYFRSKNNEFFVTPQGFINHFRGIKRFLFKHCINVKMRKKMVKLADVQGIGRHSVSEVERICKMDLKAVSTFLGNKQYMFGASPATLDAVAFGHLAQFYYTPTGEAIKLFMEEETSNLVEYLQRIKERYWSDWDEAINTLSLTTKPEIL